MNQDEYFQYMSRRIHARTLEEIQNNVNHVVTEEVAAEFSKKLKYLVEPFALFFQGQGYTVRKDTSANTPQWGISIINFGLNRMVKIGITKSLNGDGYEVATFFNQNRTHNDIQISEDFDSEIIEHLLRVIFDDLL